jgi:ribose 5-phosphate isomerase B
MAEDVADAAGDDLHGAGPLLREVLRRPVDPVRALDGEAAICLSPPPPKDSDGPDSWGHLAMRIALASDHAGFAFRRLIAEELEKKGHTIEDFGCASEESADLIDHASPAAEALSLARVDRAIIIDGAGYAGGMVANLYHGVWAAVANDPVAAKLAREHGGANALCIGTKIAGELVLRETVLAFLAADPLPGKYADRRAKLKALAEARRVSPHLLRRQTVTVQDLREAILEKRPLVLDEKTVITPSVIDAVKGMRA